MVFHCALVAAASQAAGRGVFERRKSFTCHELIGIGSLVDRHRLEQTTKLRGLTPLSASAAENAVDVKIRCTIDSSVDTGSRQLFRDSVSHEPAEKNKSSVAATADSAKRKPRASAAAASSRCASAATGSSTAQKCSTARQRPCSSVGMWKRPSNASQPRSKYGWGGGGKVYASWDRPVEPRPIPIKRKLPKVKKKPRRHSCPGPIHQRIRQSVQQEDHVATAEQVDPELREVFDRLDRQGRGWIDEDDLYAVVSEWGKPTRSDLQHLIWCVSTLHIAGVNEWVAGCLGET